MEIKEALQGRRSIRKYKETPISENGIMEIINAGLSAPSAVNLQPWYFVVIKSAEQHAELLEIMGRVSKILVPHLKDRFPDHPGVVEETRRFVDDLGGAPVCVLAFQYKADYGKYGHSVIQSVAAAIQNMLTMAYAKGIGSCWLTATQETGMDVELEKRYAPDKGKLVALVAFGYPDQNPKEPKRKDGRYIII